MTAPRQDETPGPEWAGAFAPATVSNVGPGFDCFGFALQAPGDRVWVRPSDIPGIHVVAIDGDDGRIPLDAEHNTAAVAAAHALAPYRETGAPPGLELRLEKGLPAGSGLGSSAASAVAGAVATRHLLGRRLGLPPDHDRSLQAALAGEAVASGSLHADNIAPALYGGFTIVRGADPPAVARFEPALACRVAVVTPALEIATRSARESLPSQVPLADAAANWSNAATLVLGLLTGDRALVERALIDAVIEPGRARLVPGYDRVRQAARDAGAFAAALSGSGPTLFALADDRPTAGAVAEAMREAFAVGGLESTAHVSRISPFGARLL